MSNHMNKFDNYIKQSTLEIYKLGEEFYNNDDYNESSKREYINNITFSLKKLLNNTESIFSHLKFEMINNTLRPKKKVDIDDNSILDLIGSIKSNPYSEDDNSDNNSISDNENNQTNYEQSLSNNDFMNIQNTYSNDFILTQNNNNSSENENNNTDEYEKTNMFLESDNDEEEEEEEEDEDNNLDDDTGESNNEESDNGESDNGESNNEDEDNNLDDEDNNLDDEDNNLYEEDNNLDDEEEDNNLEIKECNVIKKNKSKCCKAIFLDNMCKKHYNRELKKNGIENPEDNFNKKSTVVLKPITIKRKKYYINEDNNKIYDFHTKIIIGYKIKLKNNKFDYIFT